jgi:hypothetical protein
VLHLVAPLEIFLEVQRRRDLDLVARIGAEVGGDLRAEDDGIVVEVVEFARDHVGAQVDDFLKGRRIEPADEWKHRAVLKHHHHWAGRVGRRGDHAGHRGDLFQHRRVVLEVFARLHLHLALGLHAHLAELVAEAAHHACHDDEQPDAERDAHHRDRREKRKLPPAREELFQGEI